MSHNERSSQEESDRCVRWPTLPLPRPFKRELSRELGGNFIVFCRCCLVIKSSSRWSLQMSVCSRFSQARSCYYPATMQALIFLLSPCLYSRGKRPAVNSLLPPILTTKIHDHPDQSKKPFDKWKGGDAHQARQIVEGDKEAAEEGISCDVGWPAGLPL